MRSRILAPLMIASIALLTSSACTHTPSLQQAPRQASSASLQSPAQQPGQTRKQALPPAAPNCLSYKTRGQNLPLWLKEQGIVVTRLLQDCVTAQGQAGYSVDSPWVAMGFPCTGGRGEIEIDGSYYAPKLVSLKFSTDCPMLPPSAAQVEKRGQAALGLSAQGKLLALNPFAVQYWEIPGLSDADVGFSVDLRSPEAKQRVWRQFSDKKIPLPVSLYGRENAWMSGYQFFQVDAELVFLGTKTFQARILKVRPLDKDEIAKIRQRCEALSPRRACHLVFS